MNIPPNQEVKPDEISTVSAVQPIDRRNGSFTARPIFWAILIVVCVILIALLLIIDKVIHA